MAGVYVPPVSFAVEEPKDKIKVILDKAVYFDNDLIRGTIEFETAEERIYPCAVVQLYARFHSFGLQENDMWIYGQRKHLGSTDGGLLLIPGKTPISKSFTFTIPEMTPASFMSKTCAIVWAVRVAQEGDDGKQVTLAKTTFRKGSLYYCMHGYIPTAKQERQWAAGLLGGSQHVLRIEARLYKDTFKPEEAIDVVVTIQYLGPETSLPLKSMRAKAIQTVYATKFDDVSFLGLNTKRKKQLELAGKDYELDMCTFEEKGTWNIHPTAEGSVFAEKTFSLLPQLPKNRSCAHQVISSTDDENNNNPIYNKVEEDKECVLAPSLFFKAEASGGTRQVEVKYEIVIKVKLDGSKHTQLVMSLPFNIGSDPADAQTAGANNVEDLTVFPVTIEQDLPDYDELDTLSVPAFDNLDLYSATPSPRSSLSSMGSAGDVPAYIQTTSLAPSSSSNSLAAPEDSPFRYLISSISTGSKSPGEQQDQPLVGLRRARSRTNSNSSSSSIPISIQIPPDAVGGKSFPSPRK